MADDGLYLFSLFLLLFIYLRGQAFGYNYLPLLLTLGTPPLSVLLPNPLPASIASTAGSAAKYPFPSLRKSLRLLIEDPDPLEELENDISYVYSGYAPLSVRLVQCVAQKGGVLSNPAGEKDKKASGETQPVPPHVAGTTTAPKAHAHPIIGWKGFEDVVGSIPGDTVDIMQKVPGISEGGVPSTSALSKSRAMGTRPYARPFCAVWTGKSLIADEGDPACVCAWPFFSFIFF